MTNFQREELTGYTKQEAISKAPFQVIRDATQAWVKAGKPIAEKSLIKVYKWLVEKE